MAGISTTINLNDGMTSVLNSMYKGMTHLIGGFRDMRRTANRRFSVNAFNNFKQNMADAITQMGIMEREAQKSAQTVQKAFAWQKQNSFKIFDGDTNTRLQNEINSLSRGMDSVLAAQNQIRRQSVKTEFLTPNAASDIISADKRIKNLISSMSQLKNIDINFLNSNQKNQLNSEYENMRRNVMAIRQLQNNVITSSSKGDLSGLNNGINQIKSAVEQAEMRLRGFKETLNQMNNFSWQSGAGIEIFNTKGFARAKQEINSAKSMAENLIQTQQKLTLKAEKMKMLPSNAVNDIQNINKRIAGIGETIARLEREKSRLSRWNVSGINQYNSRIENLRQKIYEAEQAQREFNSAVKNNDAEKLNSAYKRLVGTIDRIDIDIRDNNSAQRQFNASLGEGNRNAVSLGNNIKNIVSHIKMYTGMALGGFGIKSSIGAVDTYSNMKARLGLITKSQMETKVLQDKIYESAQRTGTAYTDMASTTAKLGLLAGNAFKNNTELTKFSELMSKSFKISGASIQEQTAGMYQLTQAMASGRLQGDEFRSIIENAPMLAQAISDYTGVGMDGLKKMSREGTISADVIKNSLFMAAKAIEEKYAQMPKTFGSYFTEIKNAAYMEFSGIMQGINSAINTDGFKNFIENVKLSIGSATEWITLRFYEFKILFSGLWTSAQPAISAVRGGFLSIRNSIFSANGILGQLIRTMSRVVSSTGFVNSIRTIANVFMMSVGGIMFFIQIMSNLIAAFDWFGPVLIRIIAAVKIYNIVCSKTQGIMRVLNSIINIFTSATRNATGAIQTETAATNGAKVAQLGLNAAIKANPFGLLISALTIVISLFMDLNRQIDEVNSKTGGDVGGGGFRSQYDTELREWSKGQGILVTDAAAIFSNRDLASAEIKKERENKKNWEDAMGITKAREKASAYERAVASGKSRGSGENAYAIVPGVGKVKESEYKKWKNQVDKANIYNSLTFDKREKDIWAQYETDKYNAINESKRQQKEKAEMEAKMKEQEEEYKKMTQNMPKFDGGGSSGVGGADRVDVGTVDKIKDTVDVTDEDLKFMRDFAEREVINKIHTTQLAPQINVSFTGEVSNPFDVNEMIGRVADELTNVMNNSARGVHL